MRDYDIDQLKKNDPRLYVEKMLTYGIFHDMKIEKELLWIKTITKQKLYDRNIFECAYFDDHILKCEFTRYPKSLKKSKKYNSLLVDSMQDCIVNKIMCLYDRTDPKDFVDLFIWCETFTLLKRKQHINLVEKKFGVRITEWSFALACKKVDSIKQLPQMVTPCSLSQLQSFFHSLAYNLWSHILK